MNEEKKLTDHLLARVATGWQTPTNAQDRIMAAEILELRERVAELEEGQSAEEQHEQKRIAHAIENLCVTINTPDITRIATALEALAGCVLCNAISVTGALEVDAG